MCPHFDPLSCRFFHIWNPKRVAHGSFYKEKFTADGITVKPWFSSMIHSRSVLVIRSTRISKWISMGSVVILWHSVSRCKTLFVYPVKIYWKCFLVLQNAHRTNYSPSKVLLYMFEYNIEQLELKNYAVSFLFSCAKFLQIHTQQNEVQTTEVLISPLKCIFILECQGGSVG